MVLFKNYISRRLSPAAIDAQTDGPVRSGTGPLGSTNNQVMLERATALTQAQHTGLLTVSDSSFS